MSDAESITLSGTRADVRSGRRFVQQTVAGWGYPELADDAALVVSELITNVVLHARTAMAVTVRNSGAGVRLEVADESGEMPRLRVHTAESGTGRGLYVVAAVAAAWGADPVAKGKVVWVELRGGEEWRADSDEFESAG